MPILDPMAREKFRRGSMPGPGGRRRASVDSSMQPMKQLPGYQHPYQAPLSPPSMQQKQLKTARGAHNANNNSMSRRPSGMLTGFAQKLAALSPDKSPRRSTLPTLHETSPTESEGPTSPLTPPDLSLQQFAQTCHEHRNHTSEARSSFDFDNCISPTSMGAAGGVNFTQVLR